MTTPIGPDDYHEIATEAAENLSASVITLNAAIKIMADAIDYQARTVSRVQAAAHVTTDACRSNGCRECVEQDERDDTPTTQEPRLRMEAALVAIDHLASHPEDWPRGMQSFHALARIQRIARAALGLVLGCLVFAGCSTTATYVHPATGREQTCERSGLATAVLAFDSFTRYSKCKELWESLGFVRKDQP
jgi:hypothetical protein